MDPTQQTDPQQTDPPQPDPQPDTASPIAALFDRVAADYDNVGVSWFTPIAEQLVAVVGPRPGDRALDLGCGRGAALFTLARAVGGTGAVTGIDLSSAMVAATRAAVPMKAPGTPVTLAVMDAGCPDLPPESFDVLVASLVLFFLPDPSAALERWRELLVPGGRMGISTFGDSDSTWQALDETLAGFLPPGSSVQPTPAESPFRSDQGMEQLVAAAGFVDVRTVAMETVVTLQDVDHWERWSRSTGQRRYWDQVPVERHPQLREAVAEVLRGARCGDGRYRIHRGLRFTLAARDGGAPPDLS